MVKSTQEVGITPICSSRVGGQAGGIPGVGAAGLPAASPCLHDVWVEAAPGRAHHGCQVIVAQPGHRALQLVPGARMQPLLWVACDGGAVGTAP